MELRKGSFILLFALWQMCVFAQTPSYIPPSPHSQEFIKYGDYPVNHFTGVPDISIPLHNVEFYGYKFPITLKYHPSGIKAGGFVDPSGLGWTLFCGGEISRTVYGTPDECSDFKKEIRINPYDNWYYKRLKELSEGYPSSPSSGDIAHDEFNVTLPDGNFFKFYIANENGMYKFYTNPTPSTLKISFNYTPHISGIGSEISSFTIIDEHGIQYDFSTPEYRSIASQMWRFKSTWKLSRITLPQSGKYIDFTYQSYNAVTIPQKSYTRVIRDSVGQIGPCPCLMTGYNTADGKCVYGIPWGEYTSWVVEGYQSEMISNAYQDQLVPSSILFGNTNIVFSYNTIATGTGLPHTLKINNIAFNDVKKKVFFYQSKADYVGAITKLDSLSIKDQPDQNQSLTYKFGYTTQSVYTGAPPAYDHWGYLLPPWVNVDALNPMGGPYSDGRMFNTYSLPPFDVAVAWPVNPTDEQLFDAIPLPATLRILYSTKLGNADREPYPIPEVTLNIIRYPTGGYTTFEYESNKYRATESTRAGSVYPAGGYRIKSINNYAIAGELSERKTYKYGANECGYGFAPVEPSAKTFQKTYIDWAGFENGAVAFGAEARYRERHFCSNNFASLLGSMPPVMYDEVTEYIGDGNHNTGKTIFKYQSLTVPSQPLPYGYGGKYLQTNSISGDYFVLSEEQWKYGQLTSKEIYENINNVYRLRQKLEQKWNYGWVWSLMDKRDLYMYDKAIYSGKADPFDGGQYANCFKDNPFLSNAHQTSLGNATISESITTNYSDESAPITVSESYSYDLYGHIADKTTKNSNGVVYKTAFKYPYDKNSGGFLTESLTAENIQALDAMVAKNILAPVIQQSNYSGQNAVTTKRTDYDLFANNPLPQSVKLKTDQLAIEEDVVYSKYDDYGNPLQYTAKDGVVTTILWGYNYQYPVAKIIGADYATVSSKVNPETLQSLTDDALRNALAPLRNISRALVSTYTYKQFIGMTAETDANGRTTYYEYDAMGRLVVVKDKDGNIVKTIEYNYKQ